MPEKHREIAKQKQAEGDRLLAIYKEEMGSNTETTLHSVLERVWELAKEHPEAKRLTLKSYPYGKEWMWGRKRT